MTFKNFILFLAVMAFTAIACEDSYNDHIDASDADYVNNDHTQPPTALDLWLLNNFTLPYNIEVKYRWDASELDLNKTIVPPAVAKVQQVMEVVRKVWIDPYVDMAGETFIKKYCPKQFVLAGSASYNFDGTVTLGTAEGGRKVVLYVVNYFEKTDQYAVKEMMHTIEHEFGHILHQNISYPSEFKEITPGSYTANWNNVSLRDARAQGFITSYAMASTDEDFVEMIAMMLVEGKQGYEAILECETNATSKTLIRQKEKIVVEYFKEVYDIDFYALQTKVQEAIEAIAPDGGGPEEPLPVFDVWGYEKADTTLRFDLSALSLPAAFVNRYNFDNTILHQDGFALDYTFKLYFSAAEELTLRLYYHTVAGDPAYHEANFKFAMEKRSDGTIVLWYRGGDDNGTYLVERGASALANYFANHTFRVDWTSSCAGVRYVGIYMKGSEEYCFGVLGN